MSLLDTIEEIISEFGEKIALETIKSETRGGKKTVKKWTETQGTVG